MKLLFDQNLSFKLCTLLSDLFPESKPVRELGLDRSDDRVVWQHAKDNGFMLVSQDSARLSRVASGTTMTRARRIAAAAAPACIASRGPPTRIWASRRD
jgi:hypothetical protein